MKKENGQLRITLKDLTLEFNTKQQKLQFNLETRTKELLDTKDMLVHTLQNNDTYKQDLIKQIESVNKQLSQKDSLISDLIIKMTQIQKKTPKNTD